MLITISDPRPKTVVDLQTAYQNGYDQYPIDNPPVDPPKRRFVSVTYQPLMSTHQLKVWVQVLPTALDIDCVIDVEFINSTPAIGQPAFLGQFTITMPAGVQERHFDVPYGYDDTMTLYWNVNNHLQFTSDLIVCTSAPYQTMWP